MIPNFNWQGKHKPSTSSAHSTKPLLLCATLCEQCAKISGFHFSVSAHIIVFLIQLSMMVLLPRVLNKIKTSNFFPIVTVRH